jgi:hypothetical protein
LFRSKEEGGRRKKWSRGTVLPFLDQFRDHLEGMACIPRQGKVKIETDGRVQASWIQRQIKRS